MRLSHREPSGKLRDRANAFKESLTSFIIERDTTSSQIQSTTKKLRLRITRHSNRHAPRNTKERKVRSKIRWFTEFCNSHYLSHFAAFFIDARAKRSVVESCFINFTNAFTIEGVCVKDKRIHARLGSRREEIYKVHRVFERVNFWAGRALCPERPAATLFK